MKQNNEQQIQKARHEKEFNKEPLKDEIFKDSARSFICCSNTAFLLHMFTLFSTISNLQNFVV